MSDDKKNYRRTSPTNELDLSLMTTDSVWGKPEVSQELKTRLNRQFLANNEEGKEETVIESLWGLLGFYTRDMRLANLSQFNGEVEYCRIYLDLANDLLQNGNTEPFIIALSRVATMLELSQSKNGFLRKNINTFRQETMTGELEPKKKSLFGGAGKKKA